MGEIPINPLSLQAAPKQFSLARLVLTTFLVLSVSVMMFLGPYGVFLAWLIDESGPITWDVLFVSSFRFIIAAITCHFAATSIPRLWIQWSVIYSIPHFLWYIWYLYYFEGTPLEVPPFILLIPVFTLIGCIVGSKSAHKYLQTKHTA